MNGYQCIFSVDSTMQPPTEQSVVWPCDDDEDCTDQSSGDDIVTTPHQSARPSSDFNFNTDDTDTGVDVIDDVKTIDVIEPRITTLATVMRTTFTHKDTDSVRPSAGGDTSHTNIKSSSPGDSAATDVSPDASLSSNSHILNIALIIGVLFGLILLICIIAYAIYKYRKRDEGTYKIDDTKNYRYETVSTKMPSHANGSNGVAAKSAMNSSKSVAKKGTVKEWYV